MKGWVGTVKGRARKSVCCLGISVRVLVIHMYIHCGIVAGKAWRYMFGSYEYNSLVVLGTEYGKSI